MGSVGCGGEDEFQLCTSISMKHKIHDKFLDECGIVPRKLRSAIKKRGHGSISLPLPSSRKLNRMSSGVDLRRKDGSKKSKLKMKREQVSKDEEEVAETLFALASIVPDTTKTKKLGLDGETSEAKSSSLQKAKSSEPVPKESTVQVVKFHPSGDATQSNLPFNKESSTTGASGVQLNPSLVPISFSTKLPAWFDHTKNATRPCEEGVTNEKSAGQDSQVPLESKKSWKKCCAHVYITRLIKVLQLPERKDGLQEKLTSAHLSQKEVLNLGGPHVSVDSQTKGSISVASYNNSTAEKNSAERLLQDQQHGSTPSSGLCTDSDFLSLAAGGCGVDSRDRINRTGPGHEALKRFHVPYMQQKNQSAMLLSLPQNGYSYSFTFPRRPSTAAAQLPPYLRSTLGGLSRVDAIVPGRRESESDEKQKWMAQIPAQYHPGLIAPYLPDWQNGGRDSSSLLNYAQALFPHFRSSLDSKYKGI